MLARINKALNERMFLISMNTDDQLSWDITVEGSKGVPYKLNFCDKSVKCTCPDFKIRAKKCKHIFFVLYRVCKFDTKLLTDVDQNAYDLYGVNEKLHEILKIKEKKVSETTEATEVTEANEDSDVSYDYDCVICYEEMNKKEEIVNCVCCSKNFHKTCMNHWLSNSYRNNCPLCRNVWKKDTSATNIADNKVDIFEKFN